MEAHGAVVNVKSLYEKHKCLVVKCIMDDDSTTKLQLQLPTKIKKDGVWIEVGGLPEGYPAIIFIADPNHRLRIISKKEHDMAQKTDGMSTLQLLDAGRLKKNTSYSYCQN